MDIPSHPEADDSTDAPATAASPNWPARILVGLIGALVVLVVVLHLTGVVGPAGH